MKKVIATILVLVMVMSLCACGKDDAAKTNEDPTTTQTQSTTAPSEPGEPSEPSEPGEPAEPSKPSEPSDPSEPSEPSKPGEPSEPFEPGEPSKPSNPSEPSKPSEPSEPSEPTAEEWDILMNYCRYVCLLENPYGHAEPDIYVEETDETLHGVEAIQYCCRKLMELDFSVVEKYKDTPYMDEMENYGSQYITRDYKKVLARISTVENVLLKQTGIAKDKLGNKEHRIFGIWEYDKNGNVYDTCEGNTLDQMRNMDTQNAPLLLGYIHDHTAEYTYDANGRLEVTRLIDKYDQIAHVITPTYDAAGRKVLDRVVSLYGDDIEICYSYDENNRLSRVDWAKTKSASYSFSYTYDSTGKITEVEVWQYALNSIRHHAQYVYDANGNLVSGVYTWQEYSSSNKLRKEKVDQYTFTTDRQGRVMTFEVSYGHKMSVSGASSTVWEEASFVSGSGENIYGTYYVYTPAE